MNCESIVKAIPLYIYGELTPEMEETVEAHTAGCSACNSEVERHRAFSAALNDHELEPSLSLLSECRQALAVTLRDRHDEFAAPKHNLWERIFGASMHFRVPLGAMALVALGYFGAQISPYSPFTSFFHSGPQQNAGMISTVRSIHPDASGNIQISVDDVQRRVVSGGSGDENIRRLLLAAVREEANPGVRVESVAVLKDLASSQDVRDALLDAVQHDPNPGVRLKALEGLKQFSSEASVRKGLTSVLLNDANPGVRIQVIDVLASKRDESMVGVLQNLVRKDDNSYVRLRCERALMEMNASVGTF